MATKSKKVQSLVSSSTDSSEVLAAAGVEIKLTKSELAEYVKEKALFALRAKRDALIEQRHRFSIEAVSLEILPPRVLSVLVAIRLFKGDAVATIRFSHDGKHDWRIAPSDGWSCYFLGEVDLVDEADYIPVDFTDRLKMDKQIDAVNDQIKEIEKKNFKAFMVESVLSGSDAGKTVIASLDEMVAKLVG